MMHRIRRLLRVIPVTILAMAVLLALKMVDVSQALAPLRVPGATMVADAQAAPAPPAAEAPPPAPALVSLPVVPPPQEPAISNAERQLLQDLRNRRAELDNRERLLQERETVLDAAEHRLTGRLAELAALQTRLEDMEKARQAHESANWAGLVKLYETMKPREAAVIFNDMDMPVLLQVIDRMKDAKAASIMGAMQPDRARMLTAELAALRTRATTVPPDHAG